MKGFCEICDKEIDVKMCCGGYECGCMGQPTEPPVCSTECYGEYLLTREHKTSEEWQKLCKTFVLDADGWDRKNFQHSWYEEKITKGEFEKRLVHSTCQFEAGAFDEGHTMWK